MTFHGAQSQCCGKDWYNLLPAQSLSHNLAQLYGPAGPFTFADLGSVASPCLDEVQVWTDFHRQKWFSATRPRHRKTHLPRNQLTDAEGAFYVESDAPDDGEKPEKRSDEQDHREASLKQDVDRSTASPRLQQKRPCIVREKTCRHTYVFRTPNGGPYGL